MNQIGVYKGLQHEGSDERRSNRRYPLSLDIRCKMLKNGRVISGRVHDISSTGVCFVSAQIIPAEVVEELVEVSMDWPVCLTGTTAIQLKAWGSVIRTDAQGIVVSFRRHQFRRPKT